ncbi:MAG: hypothetical protein R2795_11960 [Saprospiraceae bacterium]
MKNNLMLLGILTLALSLPLPTTAQVLNSGFDEWEIVDNREQPVGWQCEGVTSTVVSCERVALTDGNQAVRVVNQLPCVLAQSESDFRSTGNFSTRVTLPYDDFVFSFHVRVDSLEQPARIYWVKVITPSEHRFEKVIKM